MEKPKSYCEYIDRLDASSPHQNYHDNEYGFPIASDNELFGRLLLEINQAGLNWTTILNKKDNFRAAFDGFDVAVVAKYGEKEVGAVIYNAGRIVELQNEHGSFKAWLNLHHPLTREEWVKLFKKTFKFTGGEITNEFLLSSGYLPGAHIKSCAAYDRILKLNPKWMEG
jgi:DNA-3-methyladenine glycosylase I